MPTVAAAANSTCTTFTVCLRLRRRHQVLQASGFTALPALQRVVSTFVQKSRPAVQTMFFIVSGGTCWTIPSTRHWQVYSSASFAPLAKVRSFIGELFIRLQRYLGLVKSVNKHVRHVPVRSASPYSSIAGCQWHFQHRRRVPPARIRSQKCVVQIELFFELIKNRNGDKFSRGIFLNYFGDSHVWYEYIPVATRDVLSYALVSPESFPVESTRVLFLVSTV